MKVARKTPPFCGIEFPIVPEDGAPSRARMVHLPLEQLVVHADIIDVSATVTLTQTFWQCSPQPTPRARYVFPIPAHAAVCAFEMRAEDGRIINAVAKEREVARREHKQAIEQGQMTGLVEHVTDDVFMISLGSLPQLQTITTRLTYVMDLTDDDFTDQIRLQLPVSVGMRLGAVPLDMVDAEHIPFERVSINVDVYMKGKILSITSPSHPTVTSQDGVAVYHVPGAHGQSVWYRSPLFLAEDFVLSVKAADLDKPRCFAERGLTGSTALQFSFVPKFKLPTIASQEYIFLVDRSGSMGGVRIQMAKRALVMLLRALPKDGTIFNVFSFGNMCTSLWGESMTYDAQTLQEATEHIDNMNADYGGTQIRSALCHMFQMRCSQLPTVCFLLTDGESWDTDHTIAEVTKARSAATPEAPLRMFTLGIGETTSTEMCQGIARAGGGICLMATTNEAIVAKTSKLVKASRAEILQDVTIDWGVPLQLVEQQADLQSVALLQGPRVLPPLYDNIRFIVFALIGKAEISIPQQVVLRARRRGTEEPFEVPVLVEVLEGSTDLPQRPMIHTLAARRIIMDLEDKACGNVSPTSKQSIIHLGEQYQLASRFTSFIAVDSDSQERLDTIEPIKVKRSVFVKQRLSKVAIRPRPLVFPSRLGSSGPAPPPPPPPPPPLAPSASSSHSTRPPPPPRLAAAPPAPPPTFCPALPPTSPHSHAVSARSAASRRVATPAAYSLSPSTSFAVMPDASKPIYSEEDRVVQLVRLQSFDGSFSDSPTLSLILGENIVAEGVKKGIDSTVWATVLAVAYLRKHLANQPDLLEGLIEKATEFLGQCPEVDVEMLLELADNLVA